MKILNSDNYYIGLIILSVTVGFVKGASFGWLMLGAGLIISAF